MISYTYGVMGLSDVISLLSYILFKTTRMGYIYMFLFTYYLFE